MAGRGSAGVILQSRRQSCYLVTEKDLAIGNPLPLLLKKEEHFVVANNRRQQRRDSLFKEEWQILEQTQHRLEELKKEFEIWPNRPQDTERPQAMLRETLLRISGAIQVLEEALANSERRQDGRRSADGGQNVGLSKQFPRLAQDETPIAAEQKEMRAE
jgi:hypothetical protein